MTSINEFRARVYLSRRNLLTLLAKLDRPTGETPKIIKHDKDHPVYPQTHRMIEVIAIEDGDYYTDRQPGSVNPKHDPDVEAVA